MTEDLIPYASESDLPVHGECDTMVCDLKGCQNRFNPIRSNQRFCCQDHKEEHHRRIREEVSRQAKPKKPHCGTLQNSQRLRKMLRALSDYKEHTTKALHLATGGVAVGATINDLRHNGFDIKCRYIKRIEDGGKVYGYKLNKHGG